VRNEHRRRDGAAGRMRPAQQRFDANNAAPFGGDHRLIVNLEHVLGDCRLELAQEEAALGMLFLNLRHEAPHCAAPARLAARSASAARRFNLSPDVPSFGAWAMPMLTKTATSDP
jgi:hypothetical protein